jgi:hypothetical protein
MSKVSRQQIEEWIENPVTLAFKATATYERDTTLAAKGLGAFHPFQPERTQEVLANLNGSVDAWDEVIAALEGEGLMSDESEEAVFE